MIVFIGMETSGTLRRAFQARGFEVYSCDLLPAEDDAGESHIVGDVFDSLDRLRDRGKWPALGIFHPTCTMHTVSAAWAFGDGPYHQKVGPNTLVGAARRAKREADERTVAHIAGLKIKHKVIENPKGTLVSRGVLPPPAQIIQPNLFGEDASKATCLWIWNLPKLVGTRFVPPRLVCKTCGGHNRYEDAFGYGCRRCGAEAGLLQPRWANQTDGGQNKLTPGPDRWKERSRTYPGIAEAAADQWGAYLRSLTKTSIEESRL